MTTFRPQEGKTYRYRDSSKVKVATILGERALVSFPKKDSKIKYVWAALSELSPLYRPATQGSRGSSHPGQLFLYLS
jgi:hypothetical protein